MTQDKRSQAYETVEHILQDTNATARNDDEAHYTQKALDALKKLK